MKNTMVAFVVGIGMAVLMMACDVPRETRRSTHYSDQLLVEDKLAVSRYEECVNSRFPLRANRYASVTADAVAQRILEGRLSFEGDGESLQ